MTMMLSPTNKAMTKYSSKTKGLLVMSAKDINEKVSDIAKAGNDHYAFMVKVAKENGIPVPADTSRRG